MALRFTWGEHRLHSEVLKPGHSGFTVGSASGVNFPCSDVAGAERFTLVPDTDTQTIRFARGMSGAVWRGQTEHTLHELIEKGEAQPDGEGYAVALGKHDVARLELGTVAVEAFPAKVPALVKADPLGTIDSRMMNILALVLVLFGAAVAGAVTHDPDSEYRDDELSGSETKTKLVRMIAPPPPSPAKAQAPAVAKKDKTPSKESAAKPAKNPDKLPKSAGKDPKQVAQQLGRIFDSPLFGTEKSGDPLGVAIGGIRNTGVASNGIGGMGLKGDGLGGSGGETIGLGGIDRPGRGRGPGGSPDGTGILCRAGTSCKAKPAPESIGTTDVTVIGMDKELIRQVIHRHRSEVRYCYELELTKNPKLAGKTAVKFLISGTGTVTASSIVESTVNSPVLDTCIAGRVRTWVFPKPPGGGTVSVTYPFVMKSSGN
jgi:hypothetical protein